LTFQRRQPLWWKGRSGRRQKKGEGFLAFFPPLEAFCVGRRLIPFPPSFAAIRPPLAGGEGFRRRPPQHPSHPESARPPTSPPSSLLWPVVRGEVEEAPWLRACVIEFPTRLPESPFFWRSPPSLSTPPPLSQEARRSSAFGIDKYVRRRCVASSGRTPSLSIGLKALSAFARASPPSPSPSPPAAPLLSGRNWIQAPVERRGGEGGREDPFSAYSFISSFVSSITLPQLAGPRPPHIRSCKSFTLSVRGRE
jgi:hypothetical protein